MEFVCKQEMRDYDGITLFIVDKIYHAHINEHCNILFVINERDKRFYICGIQNNRMINGYDHYFKYIGDEYES